MRPAITADHCSGSHYSRAGPVNQAARDKVGSRDDVDQEPEDDLDRIHFMDVLKAEDPKRCQHENTDPGAEVSAVDCNSKLEYNGTDDPRPGGS